ncbi:hypothetical protein [Nostoc sp.]|uniref:hypothetical protein n=1 Tax=Nostoc sp. TaxID=1180 RepID=UPI002FF6CE5F
MSSKVTVKNINIGIDEASRAKIADSGFASQNALASINSCCKGLPNKKISNYLL